MGGYLDDVYAGGGGGVQGGGDDDAGAVGDWDEVYGVGGEVRRAGELDAAF